MEIDTLLKAFLTDRTDRSAQDSRQFKVGQELIGKVIRLASDGRLLIDLGGFRALAQSGVPVHPGQTLKLLVVKTGEPLVLQTIDPRGSASGERLPGLAFNEVLSPSDQQRLTTLLDRLAQPRRAPGPPPWQVPPDLQKAFTGIRAIFDPLPLNRGVDQVMQWLKSTAEDGGLFLEKKLADAIILNAATRDAGPSDKAGVQPSANPEKEIAGPLLRTIVHGDVKGQLLVLRNVLSAAPKSLPWAEALPEKEFAFLRETLQRLLTHVETQQDRVVQRTGEGDAYQVVTHWMPVESRSAPIRFKLYYPRKKAAGSEQHQKVALLLDMDRLGRMRVDLTVVERLLRVDFYVEDETAKDAIEGQCDAVIEPLGGVFEQVQVSVHRAPQKIDQFEKEDMNPVTVGRIDIQA